MEDSISQFVESQHLLFKFLFRLFTELSQLRNNIPSILNFSVTMWNSIYIFMGLAHSLLNWAKNFSAPMYISILISQGLFRYPRDSFFFMYSCKTSIHNIRGYVRLIPDTLSKTTTYHFQLNKAISSKMDRDIQFVIVYKNDLTSLMIQQIMSRVYFYSSRDFRSIQNLIFPKSFMILRNLDPTKLNNGIHQAASFTCHQGNYPSWCIKNKK